MADYLCPPCQAEQRLCQFCADELKHQMERYRARRRAERAEGDEEPRTEDEEEE